MPVHLKLWTKVLKLFLTSVLCCTGSVKAVDVKQFLGGSASAADVEKRQIVLLKQLGGLATQTDCSFSRFFWEKIDVHGQALNLGLYRIELPVKLKDARVEADVLSVLVRKGGKGDALWLRAGPREDTGWVEVPKSVEVLPPAERGKLFRSCLSQVEPVDPDFWADPCQSHEDCNSRYFLWPEPIGDGYRLVPARRVSERVPLGQQGVAAWQLDSGRYLQEERDLFEAELTASSRIWTSRIWRAGLADPVEERTFFTPNRSMEGEGKAQFTGRIKAPSRSGVAIQKKDQGEQSVISSNYDGNCIITVFAPWAHADQGNWGFNWNWDGLPNAKVPAFRSYTDAKGCLKLNGASLKNFSVILQNPNLEVRSLQDPRSPVSMVLQKKGPYTFVKPGGNFLEVLVAANAFSWANQGLQDLKLEVYDWLPDLVKNLAIYQTESPNSTCSAERVPGRIYLPFVCPGVEGAVAKGLCRDVVVHELTHEVTGSLVELATAGQEQTLQDRDLDEALAYFFALLLRPGNLDLVYAPACQNDYFEVRAGNGSFNYRNLTAALLFASNQTPSEKIVAKLANLATLYGHSSRQEFFDAFFDFAVDKAALGEDVLTPICEAFRENIGLCDPRCPQSVFCSRLEGVERIDSQLKLHGTFLGTKDCPTFTVQMIPESNVPTQESVGAVPPWRKSGILGQFSFPKPPFTLSLKPSCQGVQVKPLTISALPERILKRPATAHNAAEALVAGLPHGPRQIVARYEDGTLWGLQGGEDEAPHPVLEDRIRQGFSVTEAGSIQGWTLQGRPITAWYDSGLNRWEKEELQGVDQPIASQASKTVPWKWLGRPLQENPRIEVLEINPFEIELIVWPEKGTPQALHFPFGREIDPSSLEVGLTPGDPVLTVTGRYPKATYAYVLHAEKLSPTHELAVFPLENPALSFRRDGKEVALELLDDHSVCKAPPYLRFVGKHLLALTCDGVLASYLLDDPAPHREWFQKLGGVLAPSVNARAIQLGNLDGTGDRKLILGPFRHVNEGTTEDWIEIRDLKDPLKKLSPIRSSEAIRGAPAVIDLDHNGCDRVVTVTDNLEVWDPFVNGKCAPSLH